MSESAEDFAERCRAALRAASTLSGQEPYAARWYQLVLGPAGIIFENFPLPSDRRRFYQSCEYWEIRQLWAQKVQGKNCIPKGELERQHNCRLPDTLLMDLANEAASLTDRGSKVSATKLTLFKLGLPAEPFFS